MTLRVYVGSSHRRKVNLSDKRRESRADFDKPSRLFLFCSLLVESLFEDQTDAEDAVIACAAVRSERVIGSFKDRVVVRGKTKADVVKFVQEAVADGAKVIQQQGDAGLDNTSKFFGNRLAHNSSIWMVAIEHSGEHYGQLVVYYRANSLVPPDSRR